jgi:hypothetical protein
LVEDPLVQLRQLSTRACGAYVPSVHGSQVDLLNAYSPAEQSSQKLRSEDESLPTGHDTHEVCPLAML